MAKGKILFTQSHTDADGISWLKTGATFMDLHEVTHVEM